MIASGESGHGATVRDTSWPLEGPEELESEHDEVREERLVRLVEDHFDFVWRMLRRMGASPSDADDGAQQVFMIATRRLDAIAPGSEGKFLYGTARRVMANMRRSVRRRPEIVGDPDDTSTGGLGPDARAELSEAISLLDRLLERLAPELRRVLVLAEIEQVEVAEIARLEGLKPGTAASRLRRARQAFRDALAELGADHPFTDEEEQ